METLMSWLASGQAEQEGNGVYIAQIVAEQASHLAIRVYRAWLSSRSHANEDTNRFLVCML